jgi:hypothetical protein
VRVSGVIDTAQAWDSYIAPTVGSDGALVLPSPVTRLEVLDISAFPTDAPDSLTLRFAACGVSDGWKGATLVRVMPSGDDEILLNLTNAATLGSAVNVLGSASPHVFDESNTVDIALLGNATLANASELSVLGGSNVALLGNEIIQFKNAQPVSAGVYRLSGLLRGRLGTESFIDGHAVGERFVLMDDAVRLLTIPVSNIGQTWDIRAVSSGDSLSVGPVYRFTIAANGLKPLNPVRPLARRDTTTGDITLTWVRRVRIDGGLRDYVDVPLMEQSEASDVMIRNGAQLVRQWRVNSSSVSYSFAEQTADFGVAPASLDIEITQVSALIGPGKPLMTTLAVQ